MPVRHIVLLPLVMMGVCVAQSVRSSSFPYHRGQKGLLTYREELHYGEGMEFGGLEMPYEVTAGKDGNIEIALGVSRVYTGNTYKGKTEMHDSDDPQSDGEAADPQSVAEFASEAVALKTLRLRATVDPSGRLVAFTGEGKPYEGIHKMPASQRERAELAAAGIYKTIIEESIAYLPVGRSVRTSLAHAGRYNPGDVVAPAAVLWTDADGQWRPVVEELRGMMPELLTLGEYDAATLAGSLLANMAVGFAAGMVVHYLLLGKEHRHADAQR